MAGFLRKKTKPDPRPKAPTEPVHTATPLFAKFASASSINVTPETQRIVSSPMLLSSGSRREGAPIRGSSGIASSSSNTGPRASQESVQRSQPKPNGRAASNISNRPRHSSPGRRPSEIFNVNTGHRDSNEPIQRPYAATAKVNGRLNYTGELTNAPQPIVPARSTDIVFEKPLPSPDPFNLTAHPPDVQPPLLLNSDNRLPSKLTMPDDQHTNMTSSPASSASPLTHGHLNSSVQPPNIPSSYPPADPNFSVRLPHDSRSDIGGFVNQAPLTLSFDGPSNPDYGGLLGEIFGNGPTQLPNTLFEYNRSTPAVADHHLPHIPAHQVRVLSFLTGILELQCPGALAALDSDPGPAIGAI